MRDRHNYRTTIQTGTHAIVRDVVHTALTIGRMAIVRGPAGIGKSYAIEMVREELTQDDDDVLVLTASKPTGGAVTKFFGKALVSLGIMGNGAVDPMERFERFMLQSFPFRGHGARKVLVIDECQHLKATLIESLRDIYDRGDGGRKFDPALPAFGLVLIGNDHFLTRGGRAERAAFEALLTRAPIEWEVARPTSAEIEALAEKLYPGAPDLQAELVSFGVKCRNFRQPAESAELAAHMAGGGPVELAHLRRAILLSGGE
ncbi:MAG: AAA family ATPase [Gemmobacter sp.]